MPFEIPPKLWVPPKPAIIRPATKDLLKAPIVPGMLIVTDLIGLGAGIADSPIVSFGAATVEAAGFTLNLAALGAQIGDIGVVFGCWESSSSTISGPAGWTSNVDLASPESDKRVSIHTLKFVSTPTTADWSYAGTVGVAYTWAILRGFASVESATYDDGSTSGAVGTDSITVTLSGNRKLAVVGALADGGGGETGETAVFSNIPTNQQTSDNAVAGRWGRVGVTQTAATVSYTTTQFLLIQIGNFLVYLQ